MNKIIINNRTIKISNYNKVLFPENKITKKDLITYYLKIAPLMLQFFKDRPLSMERFPNGIYGQSFFQKDAFDYFPSWIERFNVPKKEGGVTHYVICQNTETLLYLVNLACITFHLWLSKIHKIYFPDRLIFDLDPPSVDFFLLVKKTAKQFKLILESLGLRPYLMTTGSKGLHIVVPLEGTMPYTLVKKFAYGCALLLLKSNPEELTLEYRKENRDTKLFIDIYRNQFLATAVAPFSVRPKPNAPIATPIGWEELDNEDLSSQSFTINNIFSRLNIIDNPWPDFHKPQSLAQPITKLVHILENG